MILCHYWQSIGRVGFAWKSLFTTVCKLLCMAVGPGNSSGICMAKNWGWNFLEISFNQGALTMLKAVKKRYTKVKKKDDQDNDGNGTTDEGMYIALKRLTLGLNRTMSCMWLRPISVSSVIDHRWPRFDQEFSRGVVKDRANHLRRGQQKPCLRCPRPIVQPSDPPSRKKQTNKQTNKQKHTNKQTNKNKNKTQHTPAL